MQLVPPINFDRISLVCKPCSIHSAPRLKTSWSIRRWIFHDASPLLICSYILGCCISHIVMIAKITFLIQSTKHLLPTVNKLVSNLARQNNMASVHTVDRPILAPNKLWFVIDSSFLGDVLYSYMWALSKVLCMVQARELYKWARA